jgi:subtilase family serine protease
VPSAAESDRRLGGWIGVATCAALLFAATDVAVASPASAWAGGGLGATVTRTRASTPPMRRVFLLGLRQRGRPAQFASQVSNPSSRSYRHFLSLRQYQRRFSATRTDRRRVLRYLAAQPGVTRVELSSDQSIVLVVMTPQAGRRIFCARGAAAAGRGLCTPRRLRGFVRLISAGEVYPLVGRSRPGESRWPINTKAGTSRGCNATVKTHAFTPRQMSTAYGVDPLHSRGLYGSGVRVATLSSQEVDTAGFKTWARCFGLATPAVRQFAMPGANPATASAPEETVLDVEASLAPRLQRITPIFVPLDQGFSNSFVLFMFGALDPSRQGGRLPDILSISDGVCESRFTRAELQLGERLLTQAAALGISTLAASGDLGFQGCFINKAGAFFPGSSPFTTSVGGTDLTLTPGNQIADQIVWSTFATQPAEGAGSGGGPSRVWRRPSFQQAPGIGPQLQRGTPTRLTPDVAAMASFVPGLAVFDKDGGGWGIGGGTSAATPLTAAMVALVLQQERKVSRPRLGSLPPLLYALARACNYGSIFFDITKGTSSKRPHSAIGRSPAGGAAQRGYDLATGLGSLNAAAFADAVASRKPS